MPSFNRASCALGLRLMLHAQTVAKENRAEPVACGVGGAEMDPEEEEEEEAGAFADARFFCAFLTCVMTCKWVLSVDCVEADAVVRVGVGSAL